MIPPGTPPGNYRLLLNVYRDGSSDPLTAKGDGLIVGPSGVELRSVQVSRPDDHLWTRGIGGYVPIGKTVGGGVELAGFAGSTDLTAGTAAPLSLFWKAQRTGPTATRLHASLVANSGSVVAEADVPLATAAFPTASWQAGDVLREMYRIPVPAALPPSSYQLRVQALADGQSPTLGATGVSLGTVKVTASVAAAPIAPPQFPLAYTLGSSIALDGYDLETTRVAPGGKVRLALHWSDVGSVDSDYTVFVHLLNANEKVVAQRDQQPTAGRRPTTSWMAGEQIVDSYVLDVPVGTPPGTFVVEIGMYNATNGARLPIARDRQPAGDRIIVTQIVVAA
jgi:hypothetical protein